MKTFLLALRGAKAPAAFLLVSFNETAIDLIKKQRSLLDSLVTGLTLNINALCEYRVVEDFSSYELPAHLLALAHELPANYAVVPQELLAELETATDDYVADEEGYEDFEVEVEAVQLEKYGVYFSGYNRWDGEETFDTTTIPFEILLG